MVIRHVGLFIVLLHSLDNGLWRKGVVRISGGFKC